MPLNGESKDDVGATSGALARDLLDEVERARIGREEARGRVRSNVREVCARDAIVSGDVVWSIVLGEEMGSWIEDFEVDVR
jgi:hypothetical protein